MTQRRVAYILAQYPCRSETFIDREIQAVRRGGVDVDIYALTVGEGSAFAESATYRGTISASEKLQALLWAAAHPAKLALTLRRILPQGSTRALRSLRNLPTSAAFARRIERSGVRCVHAHFAGEAAAVARNVSILITIPYTLSVHAADIFIDKPPTAGTIRSARAVAACTQAAAERLKTLVPPELHPRIRVVRHGVEEPPDDTGRGGVREPVVLMIGRFVEKKGVPSLLTSVKLLRDKGRRIECVILGDGPAREGIERKVTDLGIGDMVRLHGWVSPDCVRSWMLRASLLSVPSVVASDGDRDGLPNVILEAAAACLPVVASDVGGIAEFICDETTGLLVPPGDESALAAAIERMIDDTALRERVTRAARAKVREEYDPDENAAALIEAMGWKS